MQTPPEYEELTAKVKQLESDLAELKRKDSGVIQLLSEDFQRFADRSQDAIYRYDIESRTFTFFNKRFLDLYGVVENGKTVLSPGSALRHIHPDDLEMLKQDRDLWLRWGYRDGENEYRHIGSDGSVRWLHDRWTVIRDRDGTPLAIEGFIRDNTRRRQAEDELERSRHNALIGSYIVQSGKFRYVNPEFCRIIAYSETELLGTDPIIYVHEAYRSQVRESALQMLKNRRDAPYEFCIIDKNGRIKWIMETVTSISYEGHRAVLGYFMDITSAKQAEGEKREKEKLQAILELAGAVGHELNNPLQVVLMCSERMDCATFKGRPADVQLDLLKEHVQRMTEITQKFQGITRYETKDYVRGRKIIDIDAASKVPMRSAQGEEKE